MNLPHVFHPLAAAELDEAVEYYEAIQRGKGLELAHAVEQAVEHICSFPEAAPLARGTVRSKLVMPRTRWRYTLHYRATGGLVRVLAVAHQKRQPFYWFGRR